jgi:ribosomal protein S18 acetylase RimI-like enzyme
MIRVACEKDAQELAEIHSRALPDDLLPRIGLRFLKNYFYPLAIRSDHTLLVIAEENGRICSFIVLALDSKAFTREVSSHKTTLAFYTIATLFRDFTLIGELVSHMTGFRSDVSGEVEPDLEELPEIYVMATAPHSQSKGVGSQLLDSALRMLPDSRSGCLVKTSSPRARDFYIRHQFRDIGLEYRSRRCLHLLLRN